MPPAQLAPRDLRSLAREMRQIFPQRPQDSAVLRELRKANQEAVERASLLRQRPARVS